MLCRKARSCFFWSSGVWSSLRLLRTARLVWLVPIVAASALAYLTRPEGLVILVSLVGTLIVLPFWRSPEFPAKKVGWALGLLIGAGLVAAGPFMILKGGISSKPSMSRLLGSAGKADPMAVERERPLDEGQTLAKTAFLAAKAVGRAVLRATSIPVLLLVPLGILASCSSATGRRMWLYLGIMLVLCALALGRVHMLAGYCTPRHALVVAWILTLAGGAGLAQLAAGLASDCGQAETRPLGCARIEAALTGCAVLVLACMSAPALTAPIDSGFAGYREAGEWLICASFSRRACDRPQGTGPLLREREGLYVCQAHRWSPRSERALAGRARRISARTVGLLQAAARACRRAEAGAGFSRTRQRAASLGCTSSTWEVPAIRRQGCRRRGKRSSLLHQLPPPAHGGFELIGKQQGLRWADEKWIVLAKFEVDGSAFSVVRPYCDGDRRNAPPLPPF